jgi:hypothetical protein
VALENQATDALLFTGKSTGYGLLKCTGQGKAKASPAKITGL